MRFASSAGCACGNVFAEADLATESVVKDFFTTAADGIRLTIYSGVACSHFSFAKAIKDATIAWSSNWLIMHARFPASLIDAPR